MGGTPTSVFWGIGVPTKGQFLSKILYRQVHWCAALFCSTSSEQAHIPRIGQISVFLIFLDKRRVGGPPPLFWGQRNQKNKFFSAKIPFFLTF